MSSGDKLDLARTSFESSPVWSAHERPIASPGRAERILQFTIEGLRRRCAPKHRKSRRETAGWDRIDRQEVFVLCWKAGPSPNVGSAKARVGSVRTLPALLLSRPWFNSRMSSCQVDGPGAIPGSRTNSLHRLSVSTRPSLQNSAHSGQHGGSLPFSFGVVADKQCTCPASKLMWERYPPTPPIFHRGENEIQASLISSAFAGATPAPATNSGT